MDVSRGDIKAIDEIMIVLNKVRFDVNGPECMRLATALAWFADHRRKIQEEVLASEETHAAMIEKALVMAAGRGEAPATTRETEPAAVAATKPKGKLKG